MGECGVEHLTIAPYHPNSNGQAERFVQTWKTALERMKKYPSDLALTIFLLHFRSTPNCHTPGGVSPSEALNGRKMRTRLDQLLPPPSMQGERDVEMEHSYNQQHGAKNRKFSPQQSVKFRARHTRGQFWELGQIIECVGQAMYNVLLEPSGKLVRAHADQLIAVPMKDPVNETSDQIALDIWSKCFDLPSCQQADAEKTPSNLDDSFHSVYSESIPETPLVLQTLRVKSVYIRDITEEVLEGMTLVEKQDFIKEVFELQSDGVTSPSS